MAVTDESSISDFGPCEHYMAHELGTPLLQRSEENGNSGLSKGRVNLEVGTARWGCFSDTPGCLSGGRRSGCITAELWWEGHLYSAGDLSGSRVPLSGICFLQRSLWERVEKMSSNEDWPFCYNLTILRRPPFPRIAKRKWTLSSNTGYLKA